MQFTDDLGFRDLALALRKGKLVWSNGRGFGKVLPFFIKNIIISVWNPVACRFYGHEFSRGISHIDKDDNFVYSRFQTCGHCCKRVLI